MKAFITGTGTDIGKTYVACGLLRHLAAARQHTAGLKPVMSGYDPAFPEGSDAGLLLGAQGRQITAAAIAQIAPWRFAAPLSPHIAAAMEGRSVHYAALLEFCRRQLDAHQSPLLIEGVGGVMVPLDDCHTVLDWMEDLALNVILVAGSYLGTISHTLTALAVMRARGIPVAVTVVNETPGCLVDQDQTAASISRYGHVPVVCLSRSVLDDAAFARIVQLASRV